MIGTILGKKLEMTTIFAENGAAIPVTKIAAGPVVVVQIKIPQKDGYAAVQLGYGEKKRTTKPILQHLKKAGIGKPTKVLAEAKVTNDVGDLKPGSVFNIGQILKVGDLVEVTGISKGKGFTGVVKAWGFAGGPASHGQKDRLRAGGSIGATTTPGRVMKGKKMAGRKGGERVTISGLKVVEIDSDNNLLTLSGSVPGARNSILKITKVGVAKEPEKISPPTSTEAKEKISEPVGLKDEVEGEKTAEKGQQITSDPR